MFALTRRPLYRFSLVIALGALVASLAACSGMDRQPDKPTQFAAGWSEHAKPLLFHGVARDPAYTIWQVPNILPRGEYRVIVRKGDTAELVDGQRFEVNESLKDIYLNIPVNYHEPEALEEKYIVGLDGGPAK